MEYNLEPESFVTKFSLNDKNVFAKICIGSRNESHLFTIQFLNDDYSWTGKFSYEEAISFGKHIHEDIDVYTKNVVHMLKKNNNIYKYEFTQDKENLRKSKFTWKRTFTDSTATLVHGFVSLERDESTQTKDYLIDFLIESNKLLQCKIQDLEHKNIILNSTVEKSNAELEKFVNIKESLESTLYGKFVQLLNAKKRRIKLLENHISNIES